MGLQKRIHKKLTILLNKTAEVSGHPYLFAALLLLVAAWFIVGIFFRYDSTWYDIMDVFVFLTTFFLVFVVQASQNADTKALQDKLDEVIDSLSKADDRYKGEEKRIKKDAKKPN